MARARKHSFGFAIAALLALVVMVYGRGISNEFLMLDDDRHLYENPAMLPPTAETLRQVWTEPFFGFYIPVTYTFWAGLAHFSQTEPGANTRLDPKIFRVANLSLHLANTLLVFLLLTYFFGGVVGPFLGAALFAIHPVQVEAVAWASGARDLLGAFFGLLATVLFTRGFTSSNRKTRRKIAFYFVATFCFAFSLLSKPSLITLPLGLAAFVFWKAKSKQHRLGYLVCALWATMGAGSAYFSHKIQTPETGDFIPTIGQRILVAGDALGFYLLKILFPIQLAFDYGRSPEVLFSEGGAKPILWTGMFLLAAFFFQRNSNFRRSCLALFVACLFPVLGLVQFAFQNYSTTADRYLYFAMFAVAIFLAGTLKRGSSRTSSRVTFVVFSLVLVAMGIRSFTYIGTWKDNDTFFRSTLRENPKSKILTNNWATILDKRGETEIALSLLTELAKHYPKWTTGRLNRARNLITLGRLSEANDELGQILAIDPKLEVYCLLGGLHLKNRDVQTAAKYLDTTLRLNAVWNDPLCMCALGTLLVARKNYAGALPMLERALQLDPTYPNVRHNLGVIFEKTGQTSRAIAAYEAAVVQNPGDTDAKETIQRLKKVSAGARPSNPGRR